MKEKIEYTLNKIEKDYGVKVLYACETGSRAWGFPSPDSDYDVRMIYMHEPDWYLSLSERKDTIEMMLEDGDLDITGWDLRKSLRLLWKSNGAMLERIQSPIVYLEKDGFSSKMRASAEQCFSPIAAMYHYLGMAKNSFAEVESKPEVKLKKLFYSLRATLACRWILEKGTIPPIVFTKMVDELSFDHSLKERIKGLIKLKSGEVESYIHPVEVELNSFIMSELVFSEMAAGNLGSRKEKTAELDTLFINMIKTYWV
jgi:predicted nucleotidyltransferase